MHTPAQYANFHSLPRRQRAHWDPVIIIDKWERLHVQRRHRQWDNCMSAHTLNVVPLRKLHSTTQALEQIEKIFAVCAHTLSPMTGKEPMKTQVARERLHPINAHAGGNNWTQLAVNWAWANLWIPQCGNVLNLEWLVIDRYTMCLGPLNIFYTVCQAPAAMVINNVLKCHSGVVAYAGPVSVT